ncbi:uncharacterized protein K452DRAFT_64728 [Aplosporella prunicola CBS 121167]|uniref:Uncharacterized protein n=1 Tax=Aplosporella prunicola CBS 121167 TaxID=1176127 RepID=A0A6A6B9Z0_9PEZI|nr:uncharacterized protein K452DRAFT_64728 [Aplosporella prunicola CBS 121167]KAF2139727.1 hypothetical protein K452DRAFT_64728 [Aplosporella prunicola CBS 121167]
MANTRDFSAAEEGNAAKPLAFPRLESGEQRRSRQAGGAAPVRDGECGEARRAGGLAGARRVRGVRPSERAKVSDCRRTMPLPSLSLSLGWTMERGERSAPRGAASCGVCMYNMGAVIYLVAGRWREKESGRAICDFTTGQSKAGRARARGMAVPLVGLTTDYLLPRQCCYHVQYSTVSGCPHARSTHCAVLWCMGMALALAWGFFCLPACLPACLLA